MQMPVTNLILISEVVLEVKQADTTSPLYIHFMHFVQSTHKNVSLFLAFISKSTKLSLLNFIAKRFYCVRKEKGSTEPVMGEEHIF
jgi:hypothetical protein